MPQDRLYRLDRRASPARKEAFMSEKTIASYGTWISPVTPQVMTEAAIGLSSLSLIHI